MGLPIIEVIVHKVVWSYDRFLGTPFLLLNRGMSVGAMLAIVSGLIFFFIGLVASQLSSMRLGELGARRKNSKDHSLPK